MTKPKPFTLEVYEPFSTFTEGAPTPIPFLIDGLLPKAALSVVGAKAKHGKSSMSRCEAVAIAKGEPFLDRETEQAEVLLCSLEDPRQHVDNHLDLLGYMKSKDARIHIVGKLARDITQTVDAISNHLAKHPDIKFVVLDTLAKSIRAKDSTSYDEMLQLCEQLHDLARQSGAHIQALAHCKKIQPEDPFDGFLGSVEIRAESDTNVVIYDCRGKRLIKSETRCGIPWDSALELHADVEVIGKAKLVRRFYLGHSLSETTEQAAQAQEKNTRRTIKNGIVAVLRNNGNVMVMADTLDAVPGNRSLKFEVRDELKHEGVIDIEGVPHSKTNPLRLRLLKPDWNEGLLIANPTPASEPDFKSVAAVGKPVAVCPKCNDATDSQYHKEVCMTEGAA
ncbi:MAG: AAA family ATPase [Candidatus Sulfotelmatobacter sp.]